MIDSSPPAAGADLLVDEKADAQPVWVTATDWPAIVSVAVRAVTDELPATEYATTPLPDPPPLDPPMTTHEVALPAVHAHPV